MKHKKRLSDLERRVGAKDLKVSSLKYSLNAQQREETLMRENTDIIVWYFSDDPPKKWTES